MRWLIVLNAVLLLFCASCQKGPVLIRVGPEGEGSIFEERLDFREGHETFAFEYLEQTYTLVLRAQDDVSPSTGREGVTWSLELFRGGEPREDRLLTRTAMNDPRSEQGDGSCNLVTDYANTDGLWIELGVTGNRLTADQACEQLAPGGLP